MIYIVQADAENETNSAPEAMCLHVAIYKNGLLSNSTN